MGIEELRIGPLEGDDVLIRVHAAGLCHTDLEAAAGSYPAPMPIVLGHEAAGEVEAVGPDVRAVRPGDHAVCTIYPSCGTCFYCRRALPMLCERVGRQHRSGGHGDGPPRLRAGSESVHHFLAVSSFAEYCVVAEAGAVVIPKEIPFDRACLLGCSVITGIGAVERIAKVRPGESVVVVGCGPVGLNVAQGARLAGAYPIVAVDRERARIERAKAMGATHGLTPDDALQDAVYALTAGRGADHVFEAAGIVGALAACLDCSRPGGTVTILGKTGAAVEIPLRFGALAGERRITRSSLGGACAHDDFPTYAKRYLRGELLLDELIDRRVTLDEIPAALGAVARGEVVRAVAVMA